MSACAICAHIIQLAKIAEIKAKFGLKGASV
ncbi:hypothetical protein FBQ27_14910 [Escherichia coli]|nr:hypothetical protein [Escherichia coli]